MALTLRTLAGLTTAEIARAFLVPEAHDGPAPGPGQAARSATPASRSACRPPTCCPSGSTAVLAVIYLLFNEGYAADAGADLVRRGLCAEAIRLARVLAALMPDEPEALRPARADAAARRAPRRPASTPPATWCRWRSRTARAGTAARIARGRRACSTGRCAAAGRARTSCRRPSPPATPTAPTAATRPTGPQIAALYGELAAAGPVAGRRAQPRGGRRRWPTGPAAGLRARRRAGRRRRAGGLPPAAGDPGRPAAPGRAAGDEAAAAYRAALAGHRPSPSAAT